MVSATESANAMRGTPKSASGRPLVEHRLAADTAQHHAQVFSGDRHLEGGVPHDQVHDARRRPDRRGREVHDSQGPSRHVANDLEELSQRVERGTHDVATGATARFERTDTHLGDLTDIGERQCRREHQGRRPALHHVLDRGRRLREPRIGVDRAGDDAGIDADDRRVLGLVTPRHALGLRLARRVPTAPRSRWAFGVNGVTVARVGEAAHRRHVDDRIDLLLAGHADHGVGACRVELADRLLVLRTRREQRGRVNHAVATSERAAQLFAVGEIRDDGLDTETGDVLI